MSFFTLSDEILNSKDHNFIDTGSSIYRENREVYEKHGFSTKRETYRIDTIMEMIGMRDVEFQIAKFDIQGSELKAVQGAKQLLTRSKHTVVILETSIIPYNEGEDFPTQMAIQLVMESMGYVLFDIVSISRLKLQHSLKTTTNIPTQADFIFVKKDSFLWHVKEFDSPLTWEGTSDPFPCHFELKKNRHDPSPDDGQGARSDGIVIDD